MTDQLRGFDERLRKALEGRAFTSHAELEKRARGWGEAYQRLQRLLGEVAAADNAPDSERLALFEASQRRREETTAMVLTHFEQARGKEIEAEAAATLVRALEGAIADVTARSEAVETLILGRAPNERGP